MLGMATGALRGVLRGSLRPLCTYTANLNVVFILENCKNTVQYSPVPAQHFVLDVPVDVRYHQTPKHLEYLKKQFKRVIDWLKCAIGLQSQLPHRRAAAFITAHSTLVLAAATPTQLSKAATPRHSGNHDCGEARRRQSMCRTLPGRAVEPAPPHCAFRTLAHLPRSTRLNFHGAPGASGAAQALLPTSWPRTVATPSSLPGPAATAPCPKPVGW